MPRLSISPIAKVPSDAISISSGEQSRQVDFWSKAGEHVAAGEVSIPLSAYAEAFSESSFLIGTTLRELLSPEDSKLLWALVGRHDENYTGNYNTQFEVKLFKNGPEELQQQCVTLLNERFNKHPEDSDSITRQIAHGVTLCIIGGDGSEITAQGVKQKKEVIGAINFCHTDEGIWVNWLGTSQRNFLRSRWGPHADDLPFEKRGIGSFLICKLWDLIEIANLSQQSKPLGKRIFLQTIGPEEENSPFQFYIDRSFSVLEQSESMDGFSKLPKSLQEAIKSGVAHGAFSFVFAPTTRDEDSPDCHALLCCKSKPVRSSSHRHHLLSIRSTEALSPIKEDEEGSRRSSRRLHWSPQHTKWLVNFTKWVLFGSLHLAAPYPIWYTPHLVFFPCPLPLMVYHLAFR